MPPAVIAQLLLAVLSIYRTHKARVAFVDSLAADEAITAEQAHQFREHLNSLRTAQRAELDATN